MELIVAGLFGICAAAGALWGVLSAEARSAGVGLGLCAVSVSALCVLSYDAPLAAAVILAVQGSLGVVAATRTPAATRRRAALPAFLACALFAALLALCLTTSTAPSVPDGSVRDTRVLGLAGLAAVAVSLGIAGLRQRTVRP